MVPKPAWERRAVPWLVGGRHHEGVALGALGLGTLFSQDAGRTLKETDPEVAGVAFEPEAFLVVVLQTQVALEALNAEVDRLLR